MNTKNNMYAIDYILVKKNDAQRQGKNGEEITTEFENHCLCTISFGKVRHGHNLKWHGVENLFGGVFFCFIFHTTLIIGRMNVLK